MHALNNVSSKFNEQCDSHLAFYDYSFNLKKYIKNFEFLIIIG